MEKYMGHVFRVDVDSGMIEIARNPDHLSKGSELYGKIQELALWTAAGVWDSRKGAIRTPHGDGPHGVIYEPERRYDYSDWQDKVVGVLVNLPRDKRAPAFTLYVGDVGRVDGQIEFPEHTMIAFGWEDDGTTLRFMTENRALERI